MQKIIVEKPYQFVRPYSSAWWPWFFRTIRLHAYYLWRSEGVTKYEVRHIERLQASLAAGHSILITPNHPRTADPLAMGWLTVLAPCHFWVMASWHLFQHGWIHRFALRAMGSFSVNREGVDRQAINLAIDKLAAAERPLIIFPEGATSRTAGKLHALLDGVAFIARTAAKKRAKQTPPGKVVIHPVAVKYFYSGDIREAADDVLTEIEQRLTWQPQRELPLLQRIVKVGSALLSLKEIEYLGQPQSGPLAGRMSGLIDRLLGPIETQWMGAIQAGHVVGRVRSLRTRILPDMVEGRCTPAERARRWQQLGDIYLAQQISAYPPDYLARPTAERVLEMIEKFEEDITDKARLHGNLKVVLIVGEPIEVSSERDRRAEVDPLMVQIRQSLEAMMGELAKEATPFVQAVARP